MSSGIGASGATAQAGGRWISSFFASKRHWAIGAAGCHPMCGASGIDWTTKRTNLKEPCGNCVRMMADRGIEINSIELPESVDGT